MTFEDLIGEGAANAAPSTARRTTLERLMSPTYQLNELTPVIREFLPAEDFEMLREMMEDWIARGQPDVKMHDDFMSKTAFAVFALERVQLARNARRKLHIHDSAQREFDEAIAIEKRLLSRPCALISLFGPGYSAEPEPDQGNSPPSVVDETSSPAWLVKQLESTADGCRCLLRHWTRIRRSLEPNAVWFNEDSFKIIPLMGKCPRDVLESSEVVDVFLASHEIDRRGRNPFMALRGQVSLAEVTDLLRRLGPRVKSTPDPGDAQQGRQTLITIVESAMAGLTAKAEAHEQFADTDEARSAAERAFDASPIGLELERSERRSKRIIKRMIVTLKRFPRRQAS